MLQILLSQPLEDHDLSSLRYLSSGGAPLAPEVEAEFVSRVPTVSIRQGYGLTESAALISTTPPGQERAGSVGLPVPGTEVRIVDEMGTELPGGQGRRGLLPLGRRHGRLLALPGGHRRDAAGRLAAHR